MFAFVWRKTGFKNAGPGLKPWCILWSLDHSQIIFVKSQYQVSDKAVDRKMFLDPRSLHGSSRKQMHGLCLNNTEHMHYTFSRTVELWTQDLAPPKEKSYKQMHSRARTPKTDASGGAAWQVVRPRNHAFPQRHRETDLRPGQVGRLHHRRLKSSSDGAVILR